MSDFLAVVENIKAFLAAEVQIRNDEVARWAEEYARFCHAANDRLRQCNEYLKKGFRAEAIHFANAAPDLLDMVAALDMLELPEWKVACFQFELTAPPPLSMDSAATLNEAYALERPVEGLMAHHRLLALARAPLKTRLAVMRRLAEQDTAGIWNDDIELFERIRVEEIRTALPTAARVGDRTAIEGFRAEFDAAWRIALPADIKLLIENVAGQLRRVDGEAELRKLMPALNDAYSAMDFEEARSRLAEFLNVAAGARISVPQNLQEQTAAIQNWLAEHDARKEREAAFVQSCDSLQHAMDAQAPTERLERLHREALAFDMGVDRQLEDRYSKTLAERAASARTKRILALISLAAAVLLAGGVAAIIVLRAQRADEVRDADTAIRQATNDIVGNFAQESAIVQEVMQHHPRTASDPAVIRSLAEFNTAATNERDRRASFERALAKASDLSADNPDLEAKRAAEAIAQTDEEKDAVVRLNVRIANHARERQANIDNQFVLEAAALNDEMSRRLTPSVSTSQPASYEKEIDLLQARVTELSRRAGVTLALQQSRSQTLLAALEQKKRNFEETLSEQKLLDQLAKAATADAQADAIAAFLLKVANSPYKADFRRAAELVPAEKAIEAWGALTRGWEGNLGPSTYPSAAARLADLKKYRDANSKSPLAKAIDAYAAFLQCGVDESKPDGSWKKDFRNLLQTPVVQDLKVLDTTDGHRYYVLGDPQVKSGPGPDGKGEQTFLAVTSADDTSKSYMIRLKPPVQLKLTTPAQSPQAAYAKAAIARIDRLDFAGWETIGTSLLRDLIAVREMDPVIRAILVKHAIQSFQPVADLAGDTHCKAVLTALNALDVEDIGWLDPTDPPRTLVLDGLKKAADQLPSIVDLDTQVAFRKDQIFAALPVGLSVSGILLKQNNAFVPTMRVDAPAGSMAYAVGGTGNLIPVAHRDAKGWTVDPLQINEVPAGSLLFVAASAPPTPAGPAHSSYQKAVAPR